MNKTSRRFGKKRKVKGFLDIAIGAFGVTQISQRKILSGKNKGKSALWY